MSESPETKESTIILAKKLLDMIQDNPSPEILKLLEDCLPELVEDTKGLNTEVLQLFEETEELNGQVNLLRTRYTKKAQVSFSVVLGGSLVLGFALSAYSNLRLLPFVIAIVLAGILILFWWCWRISRIRTLKEQVATLKDDLSRDKQEIQTAYEITEKAFEVLKKKGGSQ